MKTFREYLFEQHYGESTVKKFSYYVTNFTYWLQRRKLSLQDVDYKTFLSYVKHCQKKSMSKDSLNNVIRGLRRYFDYLCQIKEVYENPTDGILIRGAKRNKLKHLFSMDELEDMYYSFPTDAQNEKGRLSAFRNKMMVGLMVYQGLSTTDLRLLRLEDLHINRGKLYVPRGTKSNSRTLDLKPWQIMELMEYVNTIHPAILQYRNDNSDKLIVTTGDSNILDNVMTKIGKKLKGLNQTYKNPAQIRASVITLWLKQYSLRETQVMAGHRFISSTEAYLTDDLEDLHGIVDNFHPLK